jgi:hypothetical protein
VPAGGSRPGFAVVCVLAAVLVAACAPGGADGDLTDDWPQPGELKAFVPAAEVCHAGGYHETSPATQYETTDCTQAHLSETVHVGTLRGAAAGGGTTPEVNSPAARAAYEECEDKARDFLGDDWRAGNLWLGVTLPGVKGWKGGARWFRCVLIEAKSADSYVPVTREASLRGALRDEGEDGPRLGCSLMTLKDGVITETKPLECTRSHNAEFVGMYVPPDGAYVEMTQARWESYYAGCYPAIARHLNVSLREAKTAGVVAFPFSKAEWERGNRGVRCHIWLGADERIAKSLKGARAVPR